DEVVTSVKHVTDIIAEISAASQEQSSDIEAINRSVIEMDGMTQQNAALVEEAAAAAQSLQDQASELAKVVSIFKLNAGEQRGQIKAAVAPARRAEVTRLPAKTKPKVAAYKSLPATKAAPKKAAAAGADEWEEF
ncbi:MAG: methyl-accepting chemotaxis protein, partial [Burkholderiales bacterium]|nr:methyl-accepting chemotaxis protein [Burkholderiales bacterium]